MKLTPYEGEFEPVEAEASRPTPKLRPFTGQLDRPDRTPAKLSPYEGDFTPLPAQSVPRPEPQKSDSTTPDAFGEGLLKRARAGIGQAVGGAQQLVGEQVGRVVDAGMRPFQTIRAATTGAELPNPVGEALGEFGETGAGVVEAAREESADAQRGVRAPTSVRDAVKDPANAARYYGGMIAESLPLVGAAIATRQPGIAAGVVGAGTAGQTYGAERAEGAGPTEALEQAVIAGGIETALGRAPFETALGSGSLSRRIVGAATQEAGTEALTGTGQVIAADAADGIDTSRSTIARTAVDSAIVGAVLGTGEAVLGSGGRAAEAAPSQRGLDSLPPSAGENQGGGETPPHPGRVVDGSEQISLPSTSAEVPVAVRFPDAAPGSIADAANAVPEPVAAAPARPTTEPAATPAENIDADKPTAPTSDLKATVRAGSEAALNQRIAEAPTPEARAAAQAELAAFQQETGQAPASKPNVAEPRGVPTMITRAMRARLGELGMTEDSIRSMTPEQAWTTIQGAEQKTEAPRTNMAEPVAPPWINAETGETSPPTPALLLDALRQQMAAQYQRNGSIRINSKVLAEAWGINSEAIRRAHRELTQTVDPRARLAETSAAAPRTETPAVQSEAKAVPASRTTQRAPTSDQVASSRSALAEPVVPPWVDPASGRPIANPSPESLVGAIRQQIQAQEERGGGTGINSRVLAKAWNVPQQDVRRAYMAAARGAPASSESAVETPYKSEHFFEAQTTPKASPAPASPGGERIVHRVEKAASGLANEDPAAPYPGPRQQAPAPTPLLTDATKGGHPTEKVDSGPAREAVAAPYPVPRAGPTTSAVEVAAAEAATNPANNRLDPTPAQREANNFKVGRLKVNGLNVSVQYPAGVARKEGHTPLTRAYGHILRTEGNDGDQVDVFLGDRADDTSLPVFVVDQVREDGQYDEAKVVMGEATEADAREAYLSNYPKGWTGLGAITQMTQEQFRKWVSSKRKTKKPASQALQAPRSGPTRPALDRSREPASLGATVAQPSGSTVPVDPAAVPKVRMVAGKPEFDVRAERTLRAYFQPGRIVAAYGGTKDRVEGFTWNADGTWNVSVIAVDANGTPLPREQTRNHSTPPDRRELANVLGSPGQYQTGRRTADRIDAGRPRASVEKENPRSIGPGLLDKQTGPKGEGSSRTLRAPTNTLKVGAGSAASNAENAPGSAGGNSGVPRSNATLAPSTRSSSDAQTASGVPAGLPVEATRDTDELELALRPFARGGGEAPRIRAVRADSLPDALSRALAAFERFSGTRVAVVRNLNPEKSGLTFNGVTLRRGVLFVDENAQSPVTTVAAHEFTHQLFRDRPDLYGELEAEVRRQGRLPEWIGELERRGETRADTIALEELTADAVGDALTDRAFLEGLAKRNPTRFRQLADAFVRFLDELLDRYRNLGSGDYLTDVEAFRSLLQDVLNRYTPASGSGNAAPAFSRASAPDSDTFRAWFGSSKVTAPGGGPRVVYHGTAADFWAFDPSHLGGNTGHMTAPLGFFFAEDRAKAQRYAEKASGGVPAEERVIDAYLSIQRPQAMTLDDFMAIDSHAEARALRERLQREGFDGLHLPEIGQWVAFAPTQVKSASENVGTYSAATPDLRFSRPTLPAHLTAEQRSALEKVGAFARPETLNDRTRKLFHRWRERLVQGVLDQFAPLKDLDLEGYMQARLSRGTDGALEGVFLHGPPVLRDGALDVAPDGKGLRGLLASLNGEHDVFLAWIAGNRAAVLKSEDRERLFSDAEIRALRALDQGTLPDGRDRAATYRATLKAFNGYQKAVLDIGENAGLFSAESRAQWEQAFYVPFYRDLFAEPRSAPDADARGANREPGTEQVVKPLEGGTQPLGDLLSNTLENWSRILTASMRNLAAQKAMGAAVRQGIAGKVEAPGPGTHRIMRAGRAEHYEVTDPLVADALTMLHFDGDTNRVMRVLGTFKRALSFGVTINPAFRIRNLLRDTLTAMAVADAGFNPVRNLIEGWRKADAGSSTFRTLLASGGAVRFGALNDGAQAEYAKRLIAMGIDRSQLLDSPNKVRNALSGAWEWWKRVGDRAETVNRAVLYERARGAGATHLEAAYQARDLLDFTMGGKWAAVRFLAQTVPFLNARAQGMYKLARGGRENPIRFASVTGAVALASVALYLLQRDDEEYRSLPDWARDAYWCVKLGDRMLFLPKPFEVGALGSIVERGTELALAGNDYQARDFARTLLSIAVDQLSMNPTPQAVKPIMEVAFNYDTFGGRPIDSMAQDRLPPEDRFTARTSAPAIGIGQALGVSPQRVEHLVRGYLGWLGIQALNVADLVSRPFTDLPANPARNVYSVSNWPVVGEFIRSNSTLPSKYVDRFYSEQRHNEQIYSAWNAARAAGDIERARELDQTDAVRLRKIHNIGTRHMREVTRQIRQVTSDRSLSAWEKGRLLDHLYETRNRIAQRADEEARARQPTGSE
jgi:hypothetical protein